MIVAFNDKKPFQMLYAIEDKMYVTSHRDVSGSCERKVLSLHFDSDTVSYDELREYFINADEATTVITIVDDSGSPFIHLDYCIPVKLGEETVANDPNMHLVMMLGLLSPEDKLLREALGKNKAYTGTPLQIAIEKKVDEMSVACTKNIYNGIDIPLSSGTRHFTFDKDDQSDVTGLAVEMLMGSKLLSWHDDIQNDDCVIYSPEEMGIIIKFLSLHRKYNITYFRCLRKFIRSLDTNDTEVDSVITDVNNIWYGYELPEEFRSETLQVIENEFGGMLAIEKATMTHPDYTELNEAIIQQQQEYISHLPLTYVSEEAFMNTVLNTVDDESLSNDEISDKI